MIPRLNHTFVHSWLTSRYPSWTITYDRELCVWGAEAGTPRR